MKGKNNTYVLDTSVLITDPDVFSKLGESQLIIPTASIKELDGLKKNPDPDEPRAKAARKVARILDRLGDYQDISVGAKTSWGTTVKICNRYRLIDDLASNADNRIVGTAIRLRDETQSNVVLLSTDANMRNIARSYGIRAENYPLFLGEQCNRPKERLLDRSSHLPDEKVIYFPRRKLKRMNRIETSRRKAMVAATIFIIIVLFVVVGR